jgi:MFS family permease
MDVKVRERLMISLNLLLQFLGHGIYGVFIPIFLVKSGAGINGVLLFGLADGLGSVCAALIGPGLIRRFGLKFPLVFRALFQPVWLLGLQNFAALSIPPQAFGFVFGVFTTLYWLTMNVYTFEATEKGNRGIFAGITSAVVWIASVLAPLAGAFVIKYLGYDYVFGAAIAILLLAIVPVFFLPSIKYEGKAEVEETKENEGRSGVLLLLFSITGAGAIVLYYVWPLYTYQLFGGELEVGALAALGALFGLIGAVGGGWLADRMSKTRLMAVSSVMSAFSWLAAAVAMSPLAVSFVVTFRKLGDEAAGSALFAKYGNFIGNRNSLPRMGQKQLAQGAGQTAFGLVSFLMSFTNLFVFFGMLYLLYAAVISEAKFGKENRLALPRPLVRWIANIYRIG